MNGRNATLDGVDWKLLRRQKETLLVVIQYFENRGRTREAEHLQGILHLLDALQDEAAQALGEIAVFEAE